MLFMLDTNEYIFALGPVKKPSCEKLLDTLRKEISRHTIRIPRLIVEEVRENLSPDAFRELILFINTLTSIDEDFLVPFELGAKYETQGFKSPDAFIAAYTEWVGADALVTENRHFLSSQAALPFKVLSAEKCLALIKS